MVESVTHEYKEVNVFYGKKVVRHGDHYVIYVPNSTAEEIIEKYNGYVDVKIMTPSIAPKKK